MSLFRHLAAIAIARQLVQAHTENDVDDDRDVDIKVGIPSPEQLGRTRAPPIVLVEWEDSRQADSRWQLMSEAEQGEFCLCRSVGFAIKNDERTLLLAISLADLDDDWPEVQAAGVTAIPKSCIKNMREIG